MHVSEAWNDWYCLTAAQPPESGGPSMQLGRAAGPTVQQGGPSMMTGKRTAVQLLPAARGPPDSAAQPNGGVELRLEDNGEGGVAVKINVVAYSGPLHCCSSAEVRWT